jgi:hypothetical protein
MTHFDHITEDSLDALFDGASQGARSVQPPASYKPVFEQACPKCRGTGRFVSYSGRTLGQCFACKGAGKQTFRTSPQDRAKAQASRERKAETSAADRGREIAAWGVANPAEFAWINANQSFDFAVSLVASMARYGSLTDGQMAAVRRCIARNTERKQADVARVAAAPSIEIGKVEAAFASAIAQGKTNKLFLRLDTFEFKPAKRHPGTIYVTEGSEYLGKIVEGKFRATRECGAEREARILAAAADPAAAAIAYGKRWKSCSCCGKTLTDPDSIAAGIGPVCAKNHGW